MASVDSVLAQVGKDANFEKVLPMLAAGIEKLGTLEVSASA